MQVRKRWGVVIAVVVAVVTVAIAVVQATGPSISTVPVALNTQVFETGAPHSVSDSGGAGVEDPVLFVHVVGGVTHPGLYRLETGSRVVDAVMTAGGLTPDGSQCGINLARPLKDGEQVIVPQAPPGTPCQQISTGVGSVLGAADGTTSVGTGISLSTASVAQLDSLPGIGPALAQRIIDYRLAHGPFTDVAQLNDVSGIGDKVLANIAPLVTP